MSVSSRSLFVRARPFISSLIAAALFAPLVPSHATGPTYLSLVGPVHEHSGYSDGWPGSTPANYYASAKNFGNDFLGAGEHSDASDLPMVLSEQCLTAAIANCALADKDTPLNSFRKWEATKEYAAAATDESFVGFQGFEWTSDVFGHIDVYFSTHDANAKTDGGYGATMETFYEWFTRPALLGGGDDGLATFNHPGAKCSLGQADPTCNWNDFAYRPEIDQRMVGMELYNDKKDYGSTGYFTRALDKGWHVGAIGAEDLGHKPSDDWGGPSWAKTVILATARTSAAIQEAMRARRFYAVRTPDVRLEFSVNGNLMGSRLTLGDGQAYNLEASTNKPGATIEVVTTGGRVITSGTNSLSTSSVVTIGDRYYFVRVKDAGGNVIAYSSPIWIK